MSKTFVYSRVSTEEQAKKGQSIEAQIKICRKYADDNNLEVVQTFVDEGKSATNMNRPALQEMLSQLKSEDISYILIQDTDRLARNTLDHLKIKAFLKQQKVQLISVSQPLIDDSPEGNLIDTLLAATNAFQSQITGRKTSKVMEQKAKAGWYPGGTPVLGYKNADNPNPTSNLDRRIIVIDDSVAPYVQNVFKQYATGKATTNSMAEYLNKLGIKSPMKAKIHHSLIANMLKNPFYIGKFYWKDQLYQGKHQPLIDQKTFDEVQENIVVNGQSATRKRKHDMLLRGFLFYKDSGRQMWGEIRLKNGKEYKYYYCKKTGRGSYVRAKELENQIEKIFKKIEISKEYKLELLDFASQVIDELHSTSAEERNRLLKEKSKYESAIREAEDDRYVKKVITSEVLMRTIDRYKPLIANLERELNGLGINLDEKRKELEQLLNLAENIGDTYQQANRKSLKRNYISLFFKKFWVKEGKIIDYELTPDVDELIKNGKVRVGPIGLPLVDAFRNKEMEFGFSLQNITTVFESFGLSIA